MYKLFIAFLVLLIIILSTGLISCYLDRGWLSFQSAANLASIFASAAVGFSLLFIAFQINRQTELARASNSQSFVAASSNFVLAVGGNPRLMKLYSDGGATFEALASEKQAQYRYLVSWWLTFYENVLYQNDCGLLHKSVYEAWMKDMDGYIRRRSVEKVWDLLKDNYSEPFIKHFQPLIDKRRHDLATPLK